MGQASSGLCSPKVKCVTHFLCQSELGAKRTTSFTVSAQRAGGSAMGREGPGQALGKGKGGSPARSLGSGFEDLVLRILPA
jgi:hypothetical protein